MNSDIFEFVGEQKRANPSESWKTLSKNIVDKFNVYVAPDSLRKRYGRYLESKVRESAHANGIKTIEELDGPTIKDQIKTHQDRVNELQLRALEQQIETAENALAKQEAKDQTLFNIIQKALIPIAFDSSLIPTPVSKTVDDEAAVLVLSDLHFGKKTSKYNLDIALKRFEAIVTNFIKVINIHRQAYRIPKLHILLTGDMVDGEGIYPNQAYHVDMHVVNQIFLTVPTVVKWLAKLATIFPEIEIDCVDGNHGRVSKQAHELANFDRIYYYTLQVACANIPNIKFSIAPDWKQIIDVNGTKILQYHGHQIKMTLNLPWYGITTRISRWASTEELQDFDVAVQGHFHSSSSLRWNAKKIFTNGTTVAGDEFAMEVLGLESSECQWAFGIHPRNGVSWSYELKPW